MDGKTPSMIVEKLRDSEFFRSYCESLRKASGVELELSARPRDGLVKPVEVPLGRLVLGYLQARSASSEERTANPDWVSGLEGILSIFACQLGARANRVFLNGTDEEPGCVRKAKQLVGERLSERVSLADVAGHCGVTPFYFCRVFKKTTGMTLTEYVTRMRIERARRELFSSDMSISGVAFAVGFRSLSQFNRSFLKYCGESPSGFREHGQFGLIGSGVPC